MFYRQPEIGPKGLRRDLQFVASFVPASILDRTAIGKTFWDTGLAALGLKQEVSRTMADIADEIVAKDTTQWESESGKGEGQKRREQGIQPLPNAGRGHNVEHRGKERRSCSPAGIGYFLPH